MRKTLTVNLGGTVFNIDDDAYRLLDNYLSNLKMHFRKEAGADEIVDDIERRISELFAEKLSAGSQVITIADHFPHPYFILFFLGGHLICSICCFRFYIIFFIQRKDHLIHFLCLFLFSFSACIGSSSFFFAQNMNLR